MITVTVMTVVTAVATPTRPGGAGAVASCALAACAPSGRRKTADVSTTAPRARLHLFPTNMGPLPGFEEWRPALAARTDRRCRFGATRSRGTAAIRPDPPPESAARSSIASIADMARVTHVARAQMSWRAIIVTPCSAMSLGNLKVSQPAKTL